MQYMLLIFADEEALPEMTSDLAAEYQAYNAALRDAGKMRDANRLLDPATATTTRIRNGKVQTLDGPFAETKEQLVGYYVVECVDLDDAMDWAAKIPAARVGSIEVRPVVPQEDSPCESDDTV